MACSSSLLHQADASPQLRLAHACCRRNGTRRVARFRAGKTPLESSKAERGGVRQHVEAGRSRVSLPWGLKQAPHHLILPLTTITTTARAISTIFTPPASCFDRTFTHPPLGRDSLDVHVLHPTYDVTARKGLNDGCHPENFYLSPCSTSLIPAQLYSPGWCFECAQLSRRPQAARQHMRYAVHRECHYITSLSVDARYSANALWQILETEFRELRLR